MSWAYQRMLAIAAGFAAKERMPTEPASLLNEAYLRLRRIRNMQWHYRHHFFSVAQKREGSQRRVPMSDDLSWLDVRGQDMLHLDRALTNLEKLDADKVGLVELRYLVACTVPKFVSCAASQTRPSKDICDLRAPGSMIGFIWVRREPCPSAGRSSEDRAASLRPLAISRIQLGRACPHPID